MKLDLKNAYHKIYIYKGDEWKTIFYMHFKVFKYLVVSLGLTNTLSAFQSYINKTLCEYLNIFVVIYLDNIIIYLAYKKDHKKHIQKILEALIKAGLYYKLSKYIFNIYKIDFLGYIINTNGIAIEKLWVLTI